MIESICRAIAARRPCKVVWAETVPGSKEESILFFRYFLGHRKAFRLFGFTIWRERFYYLHEYLRSDPDRGVHDHPWDRAWALPLVRGYIEQRLLAVGADGTHADLIPRMPFIPYRLTGHDFHRVIVLPTDDGPSWSLFSHGPWTKPWGFLRHLRGRFHRAGEAVTVMTYQVAGDQNSEPPEWWTRKDHPPIPRRVVKACASAVRSAA